MIITPYGELCVYVLHTNYTDSCLDYWGAGVYLV